MLVGPEGPVAILGYYNWVARLPHSNLLIWHQRRGGTGAPTGPVDLAIVDPHVLAPLAGDAVSLCARIDDDASLLLGGRGINKKKMDTTVVGEELRAVFPEPLLGLGELLVLCHSSAVDPAPGWQHHDLALLEAHPVDSSYRLFPQDWFNRGGFDYGYEWVTRVARDPVTRRVHGEGIRIRPFVLDETLRNLA